MAFLGSKSIKCNGINKRSMQWDTYDLFSIEMVFVLREFLRVYNL